MFEQSILLPSQGGKKPWTFAVSILVEVFVVSVVLLVPLVYTERLGLGLIQSMHISPPIPKAMPLPADPTIVRRQAGRVYNPLAVPRQIRPLTEILQTISDPAPECPTCVVGGVPTDGLNNSIGVLGPATVAPPPKPPKPVEVKKPVEPPPTLLNVSQGAQEAKILRRIIPTYPPLARQVRVQGTVKLLGVISTEGRIENLQVLSGHPLLVPAAVEAVKQWLYRPTLLNGIPVEVKAPIDVNFILSN